MKRFSYTMSQKSITKNSMEVFLVSFISLLLITAGSYAVSNDNPFTTISETTEEIYVESFNKPDNDLTSDEVKSANDNNATNQEDFVSISGDSTEININSESKADTDVSSSNISINISSEVKSKINGDESNSENTSVEVNGQSIDLPENGRIRETIKDENTTTKIRTNIDGDGSSSININTKSN